MTIEELKKLDRRVREIPYPFSNNYLLIHKIFSETARRLDLPEPDVVKQYADWKYSKI